MSVSNHSKEIKARLCRFINATGLRQDQLNDLDTYLEQFEKSVYAEGIRVGTIEGIEKGFNDCADKVLAFTQNTILQGPTA